MKTAALVTHSHPPAATEAVAAHEVLAELEWNGILVDPAELEHQRARLQSRIDELARGIESHVAGAGDANVLGSDGDV